MMNRLAILLGAFIVLSSSIAEGKKKGKGNAEPAVQVEARGAEGAVTVQASNAEAVGDDRGKSGEEDSSFATGEESLGGSASVIRTLLQVRYRTTTPDQAQLSANPEIALQQRGTLKESDGYDVQRAFLRYRATPSKHVDVKLLVDFAELFRKHTKQSFKLAYVELHATPRLQFDFGLLKRTYSLLELLPIAKHELADLGATDDFIKNQGYGGRDIGAIVRYQPLPKRRMMTVSVGAFRGDIDEAFDASPLKLLTARIETHPVKHLRLGVNAAWRPHDSVKMDNQTTTTTTDGGSVTTETSTYAKTISMKKGAAAGTDLTLAYRHLEIRTEVLLGKRTDLDNRAVNGRQGAFWAAWIVVAPKFELGRCLMVPALRAELLDSDALNPHGQRRSVTGVLGVVPIEGLRFIVDATRTWTDPQLRAMNNVPWISSGGKVYVNEPSSTAVTLQAQAIY